ncbi:O-antigen polymerase [Gordonia sp. 852002-10350_SCH5691597]|uniref:O-antigen polymerase n=1 Tax=Gordonia sp. 852002-10350_SCH5691597 TaxID=1834085 RepID=UPI0007FF35DE|nr:O-antigen polymerase [Gordonia sp. 852002-10350_SCH5691597]OBA73833.1 hypothetical protein A5777_00930 [Gordonia sp. 852002-10350_SCH5691597]
MKARTPRAVWWISPIAIALVVGSLSLIPTTFISDEEFRTLWRSPRTLDNETVAMFGSGVLVLALAALFGMLLVRRRPVAGGGWPPLSSDTRTLLVRASSVMFGLTVLGYVGFGYLIAKSGITPSELLSATAADGTSAKDAIGTIAGVTTLTQFGVPTVVVAALVLTQGKNKKQIAIIASVMLLAIGRAYVFSERLAVLELVVPLAVIGSARMGNRHRRGNTIAQWIPLTSLPLLLLVFGLFEYFRSWSFYRTRTSNSFIQFAADRLAGYYATAINNGQIIYQNMRWPGRVPYDTLEVVWTAPGIEHVYSTLPPHRSAFPLGPSDYTPLLTQHANPEFNNPSGYTGPFTDYGPFGGLAYFALAGIIVGVTYRAFVNGSLIGLLMYPVMFTGLLEMPRYLYWAQGRAAPAWLGLLLIAFLATRLKTPGMSTPSDCSAHRSDLTVPRDVEITA